MLYKILKNDYETIAYSIRMLCYEHKYEEARKIYQDNVKSGKLPQLYIDKLRCNMPILMQATWDEEITDADKINCLITILLYFPEFMNYQN